MERRSSIRERKNTLERTNSTKEKKSTIERTGSTKERKSTVERTGSTKERRNTITMERRNTITQLMETRLIKAPSKVDTIMLKFQFRIEEKYGKKFGNYWDFHQWSVDNIELFWKEVWSFMNIIHSQTYTEVLEKGKTFEEIPKWFLGAHLNYAENALIHPKESPALICTGEDWEVPEIVTYGELKEEVALLAAALRKAGVSKGDIVACFISNRKEAITAMLASAAIGALYTSTNPLMGVQAVINRYRQVSPIVLFTVDRYTYDGKEKDILTLLPDLAKGLKSLKHIIITPSTENSTSKDISYIPKSIFLPDFLKLGYLPDGSIPALEFEQVPFSHPFFITYTSGTTGNPKVIVHSSGASLIVPLKDLSLHFNVKSSDVLLTIYSTGWVTWNIFMAALCLGASLVIYEGVPFYQEAYTFWDLIDKYGVSLAFVSPVVLEDMEKKGMVPGPYNSLSTLHTLVSGSCHVKNHTYDFVYSQIKPDIFFTSIYGSTEFMSMVAGINYQMPIYAEEIQCFTLGQDIACYNDDGERVEDQLGELVMAKPFPSMPLYFWNDNDKRKYREAFFEKFAGVWCHGDRCFINSKTKGLIVIGRSDETIKQRGTRFGSAEIYEIVNTMKEVADSLCVSRTNKDGNEVAILFVKMRTGFVFTLETMCTIQKELTEELSRRHVPEIILPVKDIPYNLNGKRMEIVVKKMLSGSKAYSKDSLLNPESLTEYITYADMLEHEKSAI